MSGHIVDPSTWTRADQFRFFRTYSKPHYAVTSRIDVTHLMARRKALDLSPYRACVFAIGAGVHAVPELRMRFSGDVVTEYDTIELSMTVPLPDGNFRYAYVPFDADFARFDRQMADITAKVAESTSLNANAGERNDLAYLSCMPWLDYSSINNALPGPEDCIPRISWGKFVESIDRRWSMAMTIEVHHALVDGRQVGDYFTAVQKTLDSL
ncbi:MAG: CatA-like O-acetyltransferase [Deltaproteobacteria bacterium]